MNAENPEPRAQSRFKSLVLDVDSTLCGVEGIDWLAEHRGPDVAERTRALTERAMNGEIALDSVYGERLALIRPTVADVAALAQVYQATIAPGAEAAIEEMKRAGVRVVLVSGGIRQAIEPLASVLGVELHAVELTFDDLGGYAGFDATSPLTTQTGKLEVVQSLHLVRPAIAVGDGATDLVIRDSVDYFVTYTGFTHRDSVVRQADATCASFSDLRTLTLSFTP